MMREALFYTSYDKSVRCLLCPKGCLIEEGKRGDCRARLNNKGVLYAVNYGKVTALSYDPIEKKPLYHFLPGSYIFSIGSFGCIFSCPFCQNWEISQATEKDIPSKDISSEELILYGKRYGSVGVAFTYNEPTIWYEFVRDSAPLLRQNGLKVVLVTNGYINPLPQEELLPYVDAMNIDLKAFSDEFYVKYTGGHLLPVLKAIERAHDRGVHIEITNLIITGLNDSKKDLSALVDWVYRLDPKIPLHFSRYFPAYKMNRPPTSLATIEMAYDIAREKLYYVYMGNVLDPEGNTTYCKNCGKSIIERRGYEITSYNIDGDRCKFCGEKIDGVFN